MDRDTGKGGYYDSIVLVDLAGCSRAARAAPAYYTLLCVRWRLGEALACLLVCLQWRTWVRATGVVLFSFLVRLTALHG